MTLRAVAPAPSTRQRLWGAMVLSVNQTGGLAPGERLAVDTVVAGTLGVSAGAITLPAGRLYSLRGTMRVAFSAPGWAVFRWHDLSAGLSIGSPAFIPSVSNPADVGSQPSAIAYVETSMATEVALHIQNQANLKAVLHDGTIIEIVEMG